VEAAGAVFTKATASFNEANCTEAGGAVFRKASDSNLNGSCAEAGREDGVIFLRDSKDAGENFPHLHYPVSEWDGGRTVVFIPVSGRMVPDRIRHAACERGHGNQMPWYMVRRPGEDTVLWFDGGERDAWEAGVADGEFELAHAAA
jgi:hypothetical protein